MLEVYHRPHIRTRIPIFAVKPGHSARRDYEYGATANLCCCSYRWKAGGRLCPGYQVSVRCALSIAKSNIQTPMGIVRLSIDIQVEGLRPFGSKSKTTVMVKDDCGDVNWRIGAEFDDHAPHDCATPPMLIAPRMLSVSISINEWALCRPNDIEGKSTDDRNGVQLPGHAAPTALAQPQTLTELRTKASILLTLGDRCVDLPLGLLLGMSWGCLTLTRPLSQGVVAGGLLIAMSVWLVASLGVGGIWVGGDTFVRRAAS